LHAPADPFLEGCRIGYIVLAGLVQGLQNIPEVAGLQNVVIGDDQMVKVTYMFQKIVIVLDLIQFFAQLGQLPADLAKEPRCDWLPDYQMGFQDEQEIFHIPQSAGAFLDVDLGGLLVILLVGLDFAQQEGDELLVLIINIGFDELLFI